jgi:hypothetical protein
MPTAYGYSIKSRETFGLDPATYHVSIGVSRRDGEALSASELRAIASALDAARSPDERRPIAGTPGEAPAAPAKGKAKSKATSTTSKGRKASKAPARKAARRKGGK